MEIVPYAAGLIAIVTAVGKGGGLALRWWRKRGSKQPASAYPVRFTCREDNEFHPSSGYHEGLVFEVFNHSEKPVTVKGFGLDITMHTIDEWHEYELARHHPPYDFPVRLEPHDGLDGYINGESLLDDLHMRAEHMLDWKPYVDVLGYGRRVVDIQKSSGEDAVST